ncbi:hypothetical protein KIW84_021088 [Lathyrus oleraceus]|uniref:Uncharacterized protein n=1 Tax=Pisum sativum TaxID=3888 RepID=A0A9D4Y971_PEA|nr:hypothetical protein KIW84_021088 [Pisum sativum]
MRIVLKHDKKLYVLEKPVPEEEPPSSAPKAERDAYKKHVDDANETACLMLATMNSELQKQHENMAAFDMIEHLKMLLTIRSYDITSTQSQIDRDKVDSDEGSPNPERVTETTTSNGKKVYLERSYSRRQIGYGKKHRSNGIKPSSKTNILPSLQRSFHHYIKDNILQ